MRPLATSTGPPRLNTTAHAVPESPDLPETPSPGSSRSWWIFLVLATLSATLLRTAVPSRMAIEHFDEGVYASNVFCPDQDDTYPDRHLYAPPGLPRVIEEFHVWLETSDLSSIAPSLLAGILLVPLLGLLARDWLGEPAARAAVLLALFSDVHILYTRTALTDAPWITWLVLALWLIHRGLLQGRPLTLIAAGLATAAGWWTKYTGWLPLAIALAGILAVPLIARGADSPWRSWLKRFALLTTVAAAAIAPLFVALRDSGGYSEVATNHARYIVGIRGWLDSAIAHAQHLAAFESLLTPLGVAVACCLITGGPWNITSQANRRRLLVAIAAAGLTAVLSLSALVLVAAVMALRDGLAQLRARSHTISGDRTLAWTMLAAWWIAMTLSTPLYHPYPRLILPWLVAGWLLLGQQLARWTATGVTDVTEKSHDQPGRRLALAAAIGVVLMLVAIPTRFASRGIPSLQPRTAIARLADQLVSQVTKQAPDGNVVIRVWGEPALFFQLSNRSPRRLLMQPAGGLTVIRPGEQPPAIPVFLAVGPHALDGQPPSPDAFRNYRHLDSFEVTPGLQVRLNQPPARRDQPMTFHLYRWKPSTSVSRETP